MRFEPYLAAARFGYGPGLRHALPESAQDIVAEARLREDTYAARYPLLTTAKAVEVDDAYRSLRRAATRSEDAREKPRLEAELEAMTKTVRGWVTEDYRRLMIRQIESPTGVRERLVAFWTDHFTARGSGPVFTSATSTLSNDAVRPHVTGRFADMLKAVIRSPIMLIYLDQVRSAGPNSRYVKRRPDGGLNENLARELLELHTLGVDGPYTQTDVRELAELLTGVSATRGEGFEFRRDFAEPGAETVLGKSYGGRGRPGDMRAVDAALEDLAVHPVTARHLATKLVVHFVSETLDTDPLRSLIDALADTYLTTQGDLGALTETLLTHPAAHDPALRNVKLPMEFMSSALRALGVEARELDALEPRRFRSLFMNQMTRMGHHWQRPRDPAGLAEEDSIWITAQALTARVNWAMGVPARLRPELPDPRALLSRVIATPPPELLFAARAAEARQEGVGIVFASPSFQRR